MCKQQAQAASQTLYLQVFSRDKEPYTGAIPVLLMDQAPFRKLCKRPANASKSLKDMHAIALAAAGFWAERKVSAACSYKSLDGLGHPVPGAGFLVGELNPADSHGVFGESPGRNDGVSLFDNSERRWKLPLPKGTGKTSGPVQRREHEDAGRFRFLGTNSSGEACADYLRSFNAAPRWALSAVACSECLLCNALLLRTGCEPFGDGQEELCPSECSRATKI